MWCYRWISQLQAEYGLMGVMYAGGMKRRIAEPLGKHLLLATPSSHFRRVISIDIIRTYCLSDLSI